MLILCMITFDGRSYVPFHIIIPQKVIIDKVYFKKYNSQYLNLTNKKRFVGNSRWSYFNDEVKLELFYMQKNRSPEDKNC